MTCFVRQALRFHPFLCKICGVQHNLTFLCGMCHYDIHVSWSTMVGRPIFYWDHLIHLLVHHPMGTCYDSVVDEL